MSRERKTAPSGPDLLWPFALQWLRGEMGRQGVSQAELARRLGCAESKVSRWFRGGPESTNLMQAKSPGKTGLSEIFVAMGADPLPTYRKILRAWSADPAGDSLKPRLRDAS